MDLSRGGATTELLVGFSTRVVEWAAENKIEHAAVASTRLKKWATGKGNASKEAMVRAAGVLRGSGKWKLTDDEADAILVALWAWDQVSRRKSGC